MVCLGPAWLPPVTVPAHDSGAAGLLGGLGDACFTASSCLTATASPFSFAFTSPLNPNHPEFSAHHAKHGDGVRDVAFTVDDAAGIYNKAVSRGATSVKEPKVKEDEHGQVIIASVKTYGDTIHSFV